MQYTVTLTAVKIDHFQMKKYDIFLFFTRNICFDQKWKEFYILLLIPILICEGGMERGSTLHGRVNMMQFLKLI